MTSDEIVVPRKSSSESGRDRCSGVRAKKGSVLRGSGMGGGLWSLAVRRLMPAHALHGRRRFPFDNDGPRGVETGEREEKEERRERRDPPHRRLSAWEQYHLPALS